MPAWYDIRSLEERSEDREDMEGVEWAVNFVQDIVSKEVEQHGLTSDRVVVGGFSQGGAVSLRTALTSPVPLGGCIALSTYLPGDPSSYTQPQHDTPVFQVSPSPRCTWPHITCYCPQAHGDEDGVVSYKRGQLTSDIVSRLVKNHKFVTYPGMMHEATEEELEDIKTWMSEKLK